MKSHFSYSQFKMLLSCPAKWWAYTRGEWEYPRSDDMLSGTVMEAVATGASMDFGAPELHQYSNASKPLKKIFVEATAAGEALRDCDTISSVMTGTLQQRVEGELGGIGWLGFVDVDGDTSFTDIKCTGKGWKDEWHEWERAKLPWYYDHELQVALYRELLGGNKQPIIIGVHRPTACIVPVDFLVARPAMKLLDGMTMHKFGTPFAELAEMLPEWQMHDEPPPLARCGTCDVCAKLEPQWVIA